MCQKIVDSLSRGLQNTAKHRDGEGRKKKRKALAIERNVSGFNSLFIAQREIKIRYREIHSFIRGGRSRKHEE